jgi:hypothetical protein
LLLRPSIDYQVAQVLATTLLSLDLDHTYGYLPPGPHSPSHLPAFLEYARQVSQRTCC